MKMYFQELECSKINVYMSSGNNFIQCIIIRKRRLFSEVYLSMYMYVAVVFYNGIQCIKKKRTIYNCVQLLLTYDSFDSCKLYT